MPIYAYKCESCGFAKDVLQKMSDAPLNDCPNCGQPAFKKQLTAAGFQLKGSGWYATDFKGSGAAPAAKPAGAASSDAPAASTAESAPAKLDSAPATESAQSAATPAAKPATPPATPV
jgi:putative FmdB family regulatory protein